MSKKTNRDKQLRKQSRRRMETDLQVERHNLNVKAMVGQRVVESFNAKIEARKKELGIDYNVGDLTVKIHPSKIHFALLSESDKKVIIGPNEKDEIIKRYYPAVIVASPLEQPPFKIHKKFRDKENPDAHLDHAAMWAKLMEKAKHNPNVSVKWGDEDYRYPYYDSFMRKQVEIPKSYAERAIEDSQRRRQEKEARRLARMQSALDSDKPLHPYEKGETS